MSVVFRWQNADIHSASAVNRTIEIERHIFSNRRSISLFVWFLFHFPSTNVIPPTAEPIAVALSCFIGTHFCASRLVRGEKTDFFRSLRLLRFVNGASGWYATATPRNLPTNTCNDYESNKPTEFSVAEFNNKWPEWMCSVCAHTFFRAFSHRWVVDFGPTTRNGFSLLRSVHKQQRQQRRE